MPNYLVAIHRPDDYDPATAEDADMGRQIDLLNDQMVKAGVRVFVGGLFPARDAKSLIRCAGDSIEVVDGAYLKTSEHVGGFWVLRVSTLGEALAWGKKAAAACRAPVEVRQFH